MLVTDGLFESFAEADAEIFDGVVSIDLHIPFGPNFEIEKAVPGQQHQHVVEKGYRCGDVPAAGAVQGQGQMNPGFCGLPIDGRAAWHILPPFSGWPAEARQTPLNYLLIRIATERP